MFFETSAKTSANVEKAFISVTDSIYNRLENGEYDMHKEVSFTNPLPYHSNPLSLYRASV